MKKLLFLIVASSTICAYAQKLPNVQQVSLRAPANIKVDGKIAEWGDKLQAYNGFTHIYYTIANDDKNLYLAIQAPDPKIISKIMFGGVALAINKSGEKKLKDAATITYPYFESGKNNMVYVKFDDTKAMSDSFAVANNRNFAAKAKLIMVAGIKEIDAPISIYNLKGINAVSLFDSNMVYTYELAINLELLGLSTNQPEKIAYNIELRGLLPVSNSLDRNGTLLYKKFTPLGERQEFSSNRYSIDEPTDFWGEYTLVN